MPVVAEARAGVMPETRSATAGAAGGGAEASAPPYKGKTPPERKAYWDIQLQFLKRAFELTKKGDFDKAKDAYDQFAEEIQKEYDALWNHLGKISIDSDEKLAAIAQMHQIANCNFDRLVNMGSLFKQRGGWGKQVRAELCGRAMPVVCARFEPF